MTSTLQSWIADSSSLIRMGLKGAGAADWLTCAKIDVPSQANSWKALEAGSTASSWGLVARLGSSEFLLEEDADAARVRHLTRELGSRRDHVYPVLREDRAIVLGGRGALDVLAQTCNVDFGALRLDERPAVLTLMVGVAVLVVPQRDGEGVRYRIWCDPSFGRYLWRTLCSIVVEAGGGVLRLDQLSSVRERRAIQLDERQG
jgi:sarcosine oxidase subunit gamma